MKRIVLSLALAVSFVPMASFAGDAAATRSTVEQLVQWRKEKAATPVDANPQELRLTQGAIPGAILLSSGTSFDLKELPADKATRLVFYCANEKCASSDAAAQRAIDAGYSNVSVMPEGLFGWKKAGQPTRNISKT